MFPYVPDVDEEDFGDLEKSEEGQSPIRKRTREGSTDNGSQGTCSSSDNGSQGGSASNPDYEIDSSNLGGREEDQSPTRKRVNSPPGKGLGRALRIMGPSMNVQVIGVG